MPQCICNIMELMHIARVPVKVQEPFEISLAKHWLGCTGRIGTSTAVKLQQPAAASLMPLHWALIPPCDDPEAPRVYNGWMFSSAMCCHWSH